MSTDATIPYDDLATLLQRAYANLEPGEGWPTNEELGGHPLLGTRDDEFKFETRDKATEALDLYLLMGEASFTAKEAE